MGKQSKHVIPAEDNLWVRLMLRANEERDITDLGDTVLADLLEEAANEIRRMEKIVEYYNEWYRENT